MAKTAKGNKRTYVHNYTKSNGNVVNNHYRSNPKTSKGKKINYYIGGNNHDNRCTFHFCKSAHQ